MSLIDLSLVTSALMKLLEDNINTNIDSNIGGTGVTVTAEAPDKVGVATNRLSLYMYHVAEEPHYKNLPGPGSGPRSIARTPMALCLFYILTAHHDADSPEFDPLTQQRLMGYALKTLHDYPVIHDGMVLDADEVLPEGLRGLDNPVQVIMRPTAPEDAVAFWGAEDQQTARLSAYYEVRVILLEPEEPSAMVAPVLSLGTYLYQLGTVHLESSRSALAFVLPETAGGTTQVVESTPARVCAKTEEDPVVNRLTLSGHNLLSGKRRQVWLRCERWTNTAPPDGTGGAIPVDLDIAANLTAGWALTASEDRLELDIAKQLTFINDQDQATAIDLFPGIYTAFVRTTVEERVVAGQLVPITSDSNEVSLVVIPRIASVTTQGTQRLLVTIVDTFALDDPSIDLRLFIAGQVYVESELDEMVEQVEGEAGQFEVTGPTTLLVQARFSTAAAADHAIRLIVNGAESAPFWIELS
ncbi:MAG: DUF4255 domain-containing protein [Enhygromyxa sp.]